MLLFVCINTTTISQIDNSSKYPKLKPFKINILVNYYPLTDHITIELTDNSLKVLRALGHDSTCFSYFLNNSDTLRQISNINFKTLKKEYTNPCIDDGLGLEVDINQSGLKSHISLNNYYLNEVGQVLSFINTYLPEKTKVWYDKRKLIDDYDRCKKLMKRTNL